jgi:putative flavoprotein involved in K+ transport
VADYLTDYVREFQLTVRHGVKVDKLRRLGQGYELSAGGARFRARNVIVATGPFHFHYTPPMARELDRGIVQVHSQDYRNPQQNPAGKVLVVGAGKCGAEIALELAKAGKQVWLAGRDVGRIPANRLGKAFGGRPYWWFISRVLSVDTPIGRKMKPNVLYHGSPLIRAARPDVKAAGIEATPRVSGVRGGRPFLEDGRSLEVEAVVWATGFHPDFRWIDLPAFDDHGYPRHQRCVVPEAPGLFFVGLHFQTALNSALIGGVGADARYVVGMTARQDRAAYPSKLESVQAP